MEKGTVATKVKQREKKKVRAYFVNLKRHCENDSGLQKSSAVIHVIIYSFIVALLLLLFLQGRKRLKALLFFFVLLFLCQLIWPLKRQSVFYIVSVLFLQFLLSITKRCFFSFIAVFGFSLLIVWCLFFFFKLYLSSFFPSPLKCICVVGTGENQRVSPVYPSQP